MPKTKQFEFMDINDMIFGTGKPKYMDMYEVSAHYFSKINEVYKYLEEGKVVVAEVPEEDCMYYIERKTSEEFVIAKNGFSSEQNSLNAIETVNWLFAKAPFMSMVGYSNI